MSWIDTGIIIAVVIFSLGAFYKAMPEPINAILYWIGRAFGFIGAKTAGTVASAGEVVVYG